MKFNTDFDKRMRERLTSYWDQQGNMLPWENYETFLVEAISKIDSSHEKTTVLKGAIPLIAVSLISKCPIQDLLNAQV